MSLPQQKRFSLNDASRHIGRETGVLDSDVLQLAKNNKLRVCFSVSNRDLRFIRLDESGNRWFQKAYFSETAEEPVYIVLPVDLPEQYFTDDLTTNPQNDSIFPILNSNALLEFDASMKNKTARITPRECNAIDEKGNEIKIAIIEQKWVPNSNVFKNWLSEVGFPITLSDGALINDEYYEASNSLIINRCDLFVVRSELERYITTFNIINRIEIWDGVVFYPFEAVAKAIAEKEYPRAKPFFDKHGFDDKNTGTLCDKETAILMLAKNWGKDIEKAIRNGSLSQYNTFGKRQSSGYFNEDKKLRETDINDWLKSEGRTFKLAYTQAVNKTKENDNLKQLSAVQLIPIIMERLGINPLAYKMTENLKKDIHTKGKELFDVKFRMDFKKSFARGGNSTWNKAKKAGLIKEVQ